MSNPSQHARQHPSGGPRIAKISHRIMECFLACACRRSWRSFATTWARGVKGPSGSVDCACSIDRNHPRRTVCPRDYNGGITTYRVGAW